LPKGQLNIPEEKKIGNNQALERRQKWPKTTESGRGGVFCVSLVSTVTHPSFLVAKSETTSRLRADSAQGSPKSVLFLPSMVQESTFSTGLMLVQCCTSSGWNPFCPLSG
jgi:hypothetical protein